MRKSRKGLVSITTFALITFLFFSLLLTSYLFYNVSKNEFRDQIKEREITESLYKLRSDLMFISGHTNYQINYSDEYILKQIKVNMNNTNITGTFTNDEYSIESQINLMGVQFCSQDTRSLDVNTIFVFNGSCISIS